MIQSNVFEKKNIVLYDFSDMKYLMLKFKLRTLFLFSNIEACGNYEI